MSPKCASRIQKFTLESQSTLVIGLFSFSMHFLGGIKKSFISRVLPLRKNTQHTRYGRESASAPMDLRTKPRVIVQGSTFTTRIVGNTSQKRTVKSQTDVANILRNRTYSSNEQPPAQAQPRSHSGSSQHSKSSWFWGSRKGRKPSDHNGRRQRKNSNLIQNAEPVTESVREKPARKSNHNRSQSQQQQQRRSNEEEQGNSGGQRQSSESKIASRLHRPLQRIRSTENLTDYDLDATQKIQSTLKAIASLRKRNTK